jgi:hypothetical protein
MGVESLPTAWVRDVERSQELAELARAIGLLPQEHGKAPAHPSDSDLAITIRSAFAIVSSGIPILAPGPATHGT